MKNLRTHGKSTIVWVLMGLMVLGLGGFGVTTFSGGSSAVGSVGETEITADQYSRALRSELNSYSQQMGQHFTMAQAQAVGLPQAVQGQLFGAAALAEEARRIGLSVGDERIAQTITAIPAFRGPSGSFDRAAYADLLRRERLTEGEFERELRQDEARMILQRAVAGGIVAPEPLVGRTAGWILETRDFTWRELTAADLPHSIDDPDQAILEAWHQANAPRFTAPEVRKISYIWLTPEMLADTVELDETALRDLYQTRISDYQQPERRMVERLVMPSAEAADEAKARLDAGEITFAQLVAERGLTLDDIDLGEVSQDQLGTAGEAVFALDGPGIAGPVDTSLGPALFSMNAILEPRSISFEQAEPDLRAEAAADRARRIISERSTAIEDSLASGASLEDAAQENDMQVGQIDWTEGFTGDDHSTIANYPAFREQAAVVAAEDFPQLFELDDGGVFALRLDEVVPPALRPYDEVADDVLTDWRQAETLRLLLQQAEEDRVAAVAATTPVPANGTDTGADEAAAPAPAAQAPQGTAQTNMGRDGWIDGVPPDVIARAFSITEPGDTEIAEAQGRVFLITLDAIHAADLSVEQAGQVLNAVRMQAQRSLQQDVFDYFTRAIQTQAGVTINQNVINMVHTQAQ
ncbi:MAG: SurA N-terminal domain-containing protein [Paracoccus sp. (in: a-proteobacteria)]|uniref:peptidylprolyl isomerase n=1 Tax=Paracoccus sp. TaxID=267 RepID=UPI0026DFAA85|nr:peptidylprolyl isomerase [Paracoccus sp. (in: a-proteobacteria)]MDO5613953.1 SurA N-terminal domain-containing protein [Paracoccus sp. (in: a-proteobacteria)]